MTDAIFLSASVPDPKRGPKYAESADTVAITAAVSALVHVTLGRRLLVWGGHPAITPMIWAVAEGLGIDYGDWVKLYQSSYFEDEYPEDNQRFQNVTYTEMVEHDRDTSLRLMRERMFKDFTFTAAVFIGGMEGVVQEFDLLHEMQPETSLIPVISTGGAVSELEERMDELSVDLKDDLDYVALFQRHLGISSKEIRYQHRNEQPLAITDRYWYQKEES